MQDCAVNSLMIIRVYSKSHLPISTLGVVMIGIRQENYLRLMCTPVVTTTMPTLGGSEFTGIDKYMELKVKAAQLIEPGSVQVIGTIGDESNALTLVTFRIGMGPGGTMVTMARACLYMLDENKKIKEERDSFFVLSSK